MTDVDDDRRAADAAELALGQHLIAQGFKRESDIGAARWTGEMQGRQVELSVARQARTRYAGEVRYRRQLGFLLSVRMVTTVMTRLAFVREQIARQPWVRLIHRWFGRSRVSAAPAIPDGYCAVAADPVWAERLLADQRVAGLMPGLLAGQAQVGHKAPGVQFMPGQLLYTSPTLQREDFTIERVQPVLDGIVELASLAETLPAPDKASALSSIERLGRDNPRKAAFLLIGVVMAGIMMMSAIVIGILLWLAMR